MPLTAPFDSSLESYIVSEPLRRLETSISIDGIFPGQSKNEKF